jgi:hypothetical protein
MNIGPMDPLDESWSGPYYELAIEIAEAPSDAALARAVERLWSAPPIVGGPWPDRAATNAVAPPPSVPPEGMASTYGVIRIPAIGDVRCVSWVIREVGMGSDWVDLCIPTTALEPLGLAWPLVNESPRPAIDIIDGVLLDVAIHVYARVPFLLGLVGEEVSGMFKASTLQPEDLSQGGFLLPQPLARRLGADAHAAEIAPALYWLENRVEER